MRIAALYDIHGNLPALEAVLADARHAGVDRVVVGGDVFPGPLSHAVLGSLSACKFPVDFIVGNGEIAVLEHLAGRIPARVPEAFRPIVRWNAEQLDAAARQSLASWPKTLRVAVEPVGDVLFCHATPRDENEIFTKLTPEDRLVPIFEPVNAAIVVCGHTHMPFDRWIGRTRVVNPGSVGMPFGPAGAYWMILGPGVEMRHTTYDFERAAERIRASGYPAAEEFVTTSVLHPPSAEEMVKLYGQYEPKG